MKFVLGLNFNSSTCNAPLGNLGITISAFTALASVFKYKIVFDTI